MKARRSPDARGPEALLAKHAAWQIRTTTRLRKRFCARVPADEIERAAGEAAERAAQRFEPSLGAPFEAYALKAMVHAVASVERKAKRHIEIAYRSGASTAGAWLSDPKVLFGTDEERELELAGLARQAAMAMVIAGAHTDASASGGEEAILTAMDAARVRGQTAKLDDRKREVLTRHYGLGGSPEETLEAIAGSFGVSLITVRRAHEQALNELYGALA